MWSFKYAFTITTLTIFVALFAIIFQGFNSARDLQRVTLVFMHLVNLENVPRLTKGPDAVKPKIAVGYGSCFDLYVESTSFLNYNESIANSDFDGEINSMEELLQSFAYYFKRGAAAERFIPNSELFKEIIDKAQSTSATRWQLGGNAPVMSTRFVKEGAEVLLAAQMSEKLKGVLPEKGIELVGVSVTMDDVHFILEYKAGAEWGPFTAPRANRYILHNDQHNPTVSSLEKFTEALPAFNPRLLVVSGLQMMDNFPYTAGVREQRLAKIRQQISTLPKTSLIHFEMASFVEIKLLQELLENIIPYSDSIGMNEQELDNIEQVFEKGTVSIVADSNPRVATSLTKMRNVFKMINRQHSQEFLRNKQRRMLTRMHVHTLAYQAIMVVTGINPLWKFTKNAAAKASLTAFRHVCGTDEVNPESAYLVLDDSFSTATEDSSAPKRIKIDTANPVSCWEENIDLWSNFGAMKVEICVAPVLVCRVAKQTAGAGDNISAAGLFVQI